ncbi:RNA 2'-phosphotransferase [Brevibacillus choshinensis]|uniref:RNA 2'-phosphotransferase n=1 Tax=Brevibacillus choshinensis TaxID=54911 RepID=A0ABX7FIJ7_BRECH|nr:RNA 2'-phosphotransferase [Brevibacillus choshinensis]QRG65151.1 RNA 2'-phosphotransferase [Brevibacillus choshinensis]
MEGLDASQIRALYGHSVPQKIVKTTGIPPSILYHGTSRDSIKRIIAEGILPMGRQYVHLSVDREMAMQVGKRKDRKPVLLQVNAEKASIEGIAFYQGNHAVWLADRVPSTFITLLEESVEP